MKIVVTGSLGYVGKPVAAQLIAKGHLVTVVSSNAAKQQDIEALGATAAIGSMDDADFLTQTFTGADAVYCMLAPYGNFMDQGNTAEKIIASAGKIADSYVQAIERSGVKRVVYLSSIGAEMGSEAGLIIVHHNAEITLGKLPADVSISFMRPSGFYKNLFAFLPGIKSQGIIAARYGGDDKNVFVSNIDIAEAIVEELESHETGRKVRYIASDIKTCNEAATILGEAIGRPDLKWISITDEQQLNAYKSFGMNESIAGQFVVMNRSIQEGKFWEDFNRQQITLGKVKMTDFATEFAAVYQQQ